MTIHLLFFTITLKVSKMTAEEKSKEAIQYESFKKIREENIVRAIQHGYFW